VAGGTFVVLLNPDKGTLQIRRIGDDGKLGAITQTKNGFTTGWTTAAVYTVLLGKYLALIKP
jgi:hypothetical protein